MDGQTDRTHHTLLSTTMKTAHGAMHAAVEEWLDGCLVKLRTGVLTEADLRRGARVLEAEHAPRQRLLYLYSKSTNPRSSLSAWALYDPAAADEPVLPSQDVPYTSVLDAVRDGWRIVQFPRPEVYRFSDLYNAYLGFEFILEKLT